MSRSQCRTAWSGCTLAPLRVCAVVVVFFAAGCPGPSRSVGVKPAPRVRTVRDVRVLLATSRSNVRVRVPGPYTIRNRSGTVRQRGKALRWALVSSGPDVTLGGESLGASWIEIIPAPSGVVAVSKRTKSGWSPGRQYGGHLRLQTQADGSVNVINIVDVETYVAGVLPGEVYPTFQPEAFRAQAIAARTYCLYEMSTKSTSDYDVVASEASQVYQGMSGSAAYRKARAAVDHTRGVVCTWTSPDGERIFCTFYSSACGGMTQDVADAQSARSIPPLAGGVRCDYCRIAGGEAYRWKTRSLSKPELMSRLVRRYPRVARLGNLADLQVRRCETCGRACSIRVVGDTGKRFELSAENFRLAAGSRTMRSTDCRIRLTGNSVAFENGKGFGHGVGLCQWGMEGQARLGRTATQILRYYYPHSHLTRAY